MKKAGQITKWLKINGKTFQQAAEILGFKSENGFRDAINNGTLTPIRTVQLAELVGKTHAVLVDFLTDGALDTGMVNEPNISYAKSISRAENPHDFIR